MDRSALASPAADADSRSLSAMYEISKILGASLALERSLHDVVNLLSSYLDLRRGVVALREAGDTLAVVAASGASLTQARAGGGGVVWPALQQVLETAVPLVVASVDDDPLFSGYTPSPDLLDDEQVSYLAVPIRTTDKPLGVLSVERHHPPHARGGTFSADVRFLTMVANLIAQSVRLHQAVVADRQVLLQETARLHKQVSAQQRHDLALDDLDSPLIGSSDAMQRVYAQVARVANTHLTVLLRGESGTGKELVARAVHQHSPRADKPYVAVNCAALPESLLESELFGHEKGAFTGATQARKGRFELADGGTLFLDEIGEITPPFQAKLLRVLQEGTFERVGGTRTVSTDVRVIAATNRDLEAMVAAGDFRADLYYRINVLPIFLPPLRDRTGDVAELARYFLKQFNQAHDRTLRFDTPALKVLTACTFPGNVRELENCVSRAATLAQGDTTVRPEDFACQHGGCLSAALWEGVLPGTGRPVDATPPSPPASSSSASPSPASPSPPPAAEGEGPIPEDLPEEDRLRLAMERAGWVQAKAARLLGLTPRQVGYALRKHGIEIKRF